jgi:hypothetical protein
MYLLNLKEPVMKLSAYEFPLLVFVLLIIAQPQLSVAAHISENDGKSLSEDKIQELKAHALKGDGKAALRLSSDPEFSKKEQMYWATISAEDGFLPGIYNLGMWLSEDENNPLNRIRARYWLKIAKARGEKFADFGLCTIDRKDNPALPVCQLPSNAIEHH